MISVITSVSGEQGFKTLKKNLVNLEVDWQIGVDILCLVRNENLYIDCRDFLRENVDRGECLVVPGTSERPFKEAVEILSDKNKYVYLCGENYIIPRGGLTKLSRDYAEKPTAGLISGFLSEYPTVLWVEDVYGWPHYIYSNEKQLPSSSLVEIDTCAVEGCMTQTSLFKELFGFSDLDGYGGYSYGVRLRRQGYKNYLDTGVEIKMEVSNENNSSKRSAR